MSLWCPKCYNRKFGETIHIEQEDDGEGNTVYKCGECGHVFPAPEFPDPLIPVYMKYSELNAVRNLIELGKREIVGDWDLGLIETIIHDAEYKTGNDCIFCQQLTERVYMRHTTPPVYMCSRCEKVFTMMLDAVGYH